MYIEIKNLPPMPRNRSHMVARNMLIKTPLARAFEEDLFDRLKKMDQTMFESFKKQFDPKKHYITAQYIIYTPEDELFTKDGRISHRAVDTDAHKLMQDVIFKHMKIDDALIRYSSYSTPVSGDGNWNYFIIINTAPLEYLRGAVGIEGDL